MVAKHVFFLKDDNMLDKYNKIWNVIKNKINIKFYCMPIYDKTFIKVKVRLRQIFKVIKCQKKICTVLALLL